MRRSDAAEPLSFLRSARAVRVRQVRGQAETDIPLVEAIRRSGELPHSHSVADVLDVVVTVLPATTLVGFLFLHHRPVAVEKDVFWIVDDFKGQEDGVEEWAVDGSYNKRAIRLLVYHGFDGGAR